MMACSGVLLKRAWSPLTPQADGPCFTLVPRDGGGVCILESGAVLCSRDRASQLVIVASCLVEKGGCDLVCALILKQPHFQSPHEGGSSTDLSCRPPRAPGLSAMSSSKVGILQAQEPAGSLGLSLGELLRAPVVLSVL